MTLPSRNDRRTSSAAATLEKAAPSRLSSKPGLPSNYGKPREKTAFDHFLIEFCRTSAGKLGSLTAGAERNCKSLLPNSEQPRRSGELCNVNDSKGQDKGPNEGRLGQLLESRKAHFRSLVNKFDQTQLQQQARIQPFESKTLPKKFGSGWPNSFESRLEKSSGGKRED